MTGAAQILTDSNLYLAFISTSGILGLLSSLLKTMQSAINRFLESRIHTPSLSTTDSSLDTTPSSNSSGDP